MTSNSEKPLHTKYRPDCFEDFLGNEATKKSVLQGIGKTHCYLLVGEKGCGKTTLARLIGKELGIDREVGHQWDTHEVNAADKTGVGDAREIISKAWNMPMNGKRKIYIIDECHRLSSNAMDSLLKILEEPPDHVYFVLCTTNPSKVIGTIKSRSAVYTLGRLRKRIIEELLDRVLEQEQVDISNGVFGAIIDSADGIPRDALVLLGMVIGMDDEPALEIARRGTSESVEIKKLLEFMTSKKFAKKEHWPEVAGLLKNISDDPETVRRSILGYFGAIMLNSSGPVLNNAAFVCNCFEEDFFASGKVGLYLALYRSMSMES